MNEWFHRRGLDRKMQHPRTPRQVDRLTSDDTIM